MPSKYLYKPLFKRYEQFKCFTKIQKIANLRAISPWEWCPDNFWWKRRLCPSETYWFFKKNRTQKRWFKIQKHEKYLKSKNDIKRRLGAFNQELWANFEFENSEISELFPPGTTARYWLKKRNYWCKRGLSPPET